MGKGIIVVKEIPETCFECDMKRRPFDMSHPEDMLCGIINKSISSHKPHKIFGSKPDWRPIKEIPCRLDELQVPHTMSDYQRKGFARGWNALVDKIEGDD